MSTVRVAPGDVLRGKYRIKRVLGEGGVGVVVRATHLRLDQDVAIKMLRDAEAPPHVVERFAREARAAARLRGEHAVRILDVDDDAGSAPFLVMEYLEGRDLDRAVRADGPLPVARAASLLLQACEGLAEAHAIGIVHRDVKPANLFLAKTARGGELLKILDFGISKAAEDAQPLITETERMLGSPSFMSPEQLKAAHDVDARTDVWSLGVVAYFLVSGELPFGADSATAVAARIASDAPKPLRAARGDVPAEFVAVVERCLAKDRDLRFGSMAELAHALAPFAEEGEAAARRVSSLMRVPAPSAVARDDADRGSLPPAPLTATVSIDQTGSASATRSVDAPNVFGAPIVTGTSDARGASESAPAAAPGAPRRRVRELRVPLRKRTLAIALAASAVSFGAVWYAAHRAGVRGALEGERGGTATAPGVCHGTIKVRILYDATGRTRDVGVPDGKAMEDTIHAINDGGGIRGCLVEAEVADNRYDGDVAVRAVREWQKRPDWRDVSTVFTQGTPVVTAVAPLAARDGKVVVSTARNAEFAAPVAIERDLGVPSLNQSFVEGTLPARVGSPGYPNVFFAGTDYTTIARIAMNFAWLRGAHRVGFFACTTSAFCTDPVLGAKTFLPRLGGTKIGRDLPIELADDAATVETKVAAYFKSEQDQAARDPSYAPVDWIWFGNTRTTLAHLGRALSKLKGPRPVVVANNWALDEALYEVCGEECNGMYGVQPYPIFGETAATPAMQHVLDIHRAARARAHEPATAYTSAPYVSGYVVVTMWRAAVESVIDAGGHVDGASLRAAFERFHFQSIDGLAVVSFSPTDHRPQSTARIYTVAPQGKLQPVGQPISIALQPDWLGW